MQDGEQFTWQEHSDIFKKFREGKHTIHRSAYPEKCFGGVWSDMGIEQSINSDCGTVGGLTAIKTKKLQWIAGILQHA